MREGWEIKKLGEVAAILNGYAFKSEKYENEGVRIIRITNVQKGYITDDDPKFYPAQEEIIDKYKLYPNDLLISLTGNVGRVGLMPAEMLPAALNQRVACIRPITQKLLLRYLFYHLNNSIFEEACIKWSKGLAQKNMSTEWLKEYPLIIPPLSEQKRIVAELDLLSEVIAKRREQLTQLDALAQSLFYTMFGDPITNEKGWNVQLLGNVCKFSQGIQVDLSLQSLEPKENWNRFLRISDYTIGNVEKRYVDVQDLKYYVYPDDVVIVRYGASAGYVGINKEGILANNLFKLNHNKLLCDHIFLYWYLSSDYYKNFIRDVVFGAAMPALSFSSLKNFKVFIPPLALQQQFAEKIEAIEQQKERIRQSLAEVQLLFDSRMDYYFNEWAE